MKKNALIITIISIVAVLVVGVVITLAVIGITMNNKKSKKSSEDETVKTINVEEYELKLGRYRGVFKEYDDNRNVESEEETIIVLFEDYFIYEEEPNKKYEFIIKGKELYYNNVPFFLVKGNDKLELEMGGGVEFNYVGKANSKSNSTSSSKSNSTNTTNTKNTTNATNTANTAKSTTNTSNTAKTNTTNTTKQNSKTDANVKIKQSETSSLKLVDYKSAEFTMKIPEGWKVSKGGYGVYFGIKVYDPKDDRNQIFYIIKEQPFYKYNDAESYYIQSRGYCPGIIMGGSPTTEQVFKRQNALANKAKELETSVGAQEYKGFEFPYISNFKVVETSEGNSILHSKAVDDKVLRATFNNGSASNDGEAEGLFSACVVDFGTLGYGNDKFSYYMAYNVSGITTAKDNLINYEDILLKSLNSLQFTTSYTQSTVDQINMSTQSALNVASQLRQSYQSYNNAWTNRQKSYDIQSQKRSDATLGYERVYDTETGEIYKAYNGFMDNYSGSRYKTISDSQYTEKIAGYIEK